MQKKIVGMVASTALVCAILPQAGQAAETMHIESVNSADQTVTLKYTGASAGDWYHVYVADKVLFNTLSAIDASGGSKAVDVSSIGPLQNGVIVRTDMKSNITNSYLTDSQVFVDATTPATGISLKLDGALKPDGTSQNLTLTIQGAYSPQNTDIVRVTGYNANGGVEGNAQLFRLPAEVLANSSQPFHIPLTPTDKVARYSIDLLRNYNDVLATASYSFVGSPGPVPDTISDNLALNYPNSVKAGEAVTGQVLMKDEKGLVLDVSSLVQYTFAGPIAADSFKNGSFTVAKEAKDGELIIVTAKIGDYTASKSIRVGAETPASNNSVTMVINSKTLNVNGKESQMEVAPFIQDNRTFVPLRALAESFGAEVEFKPNDYTITITQNGVVTKMKAGDTNYTVNGVGKTMDVAPYIAYSGRTIVPVRFAAEGLGYKVDAIAAADGTTEKVVFSK